MKATRRTVLGGGAMLAAAAVPAMRASAQPALYVRESLAGLTRQQSPLIESFRRGADAMMRLPTWDKRNWWFQAYMYGVAAGQVPPDMKASAERYFNKSPHRNFFFLAWNRIHLYYFERILRAGSGDPRFTLPYWAFDDPAQSRVPAAFLPDRDQVSAATVSPYARRNALARALRHPQVDLGEAGLRPTTALDCAAVARLSAFATRDKAEILQTLGGANTQSPAEGIGVGGLEAVANDVHDTLGLFGGDLGSMLTAARDPLFWSLRANLDRLWSKWTDIASGHELPVRDSYWMNTVFTFVDENGQDVRIGAQHILDPQFQLRYRYDDELTRDAQFAFAQTMPARPLPRQASVLARIAELKLGERDNRAAFPPVSGLSMTDVQTGTFRLVVRDVAARSRTSPYDIFLGAGAATPVRVGTLALYAGAAAERPAAGVAVTLTFDATAAVQQLARAVGAALGGAGVVVVRRGLADASGQELVGADPEPPRIGSVELVKVQTG